MREESIEPAPVLPAGGTRPAGPGVKAPAQPTEQTPTVEGEFGGVQQPPPPPLPPGSEGPLDTPQGSGGGGDRP